MFFRRNLISLMLNGFKGVDFEQNFMDFSIMLLIFIYISVTFERFKLNMLVLVLDFSNVGVL